MSHWLVIVCLLAVYTVDASLVRVASPSPSSSESPSPSGPPTGATLTYGGGFIMAHVRAVVVLYGAGTYNPQSNRTDAPSVSSFYTQLLTQSTMFSLMQQYNTPTVNGTDQVFSDGGNLGLIKITPSAENYNTTITDAQVQSELTAQIAAGHLPAPAIDQQGFPVTLYSVHFPAEVSVNGPGSTGLPCVSGGYCGYHNAFLVNTSTIVYAIHPNCDSYPLVSCNQAGFYSAYATIAHEVFEAMTDPTPLSITTWYSQGTNDEIADLCAQIGGPWAACDNQTYGLQALYSNRDAACVLPRSACTSGGSASPSESPSQSVPPCSTVYVSSSNSALSGAYVQQSSLVGGRHWYTYGPYMLIYNHYDLGKFGWNIWYQNFSMLFTASLCGAQNVFDCPAAGFTPSTVAVTCTTASPTATPHPSVAPVSGVVTGDLITTGTGFVITIGGPTTITGATFGALSGATLVVTASVHANRIVVGAGATLSITTAVAAVSGSSVQINGTYAVFVGSATPSVITVTGHADNNGPLVLYIAPGFTFGVGTQVTVINFGSATGSFSSVTIMAASSNTNTRALQATSASVSCGPSSCVATGTSASAAATPAPPCSDYACRVGVGVGVGVGGGLLLIGLLLAICCCVRRRPTPKASDPAAQRQPEESDYDDSQPSSDSQDPSTDDTGDDSTGTESTLPATYSA